MGWDITDTELKSNTAADGFGVFAFYTGLEDYPNVTSTSTPAPASVTPNNNLTYKMATTGKNVDLLWGTCPTDATGTYNVAPSGTQTGDYVWVIKLHPQLLL
jgi:hypothetical protein